jgi:hypothetical protein
MLTITATTVLAEIVTATAMAVPMVTIPPPLPMVMMSMRTTAAFLRTAIGQQQWDDNNVMAMVGQQHADCWQVLRHQSKAKIN